MPGRKWTVAEKQAASQRAKARIASGEFVPFHKKGSVPPPSEPGEEPSSAGPIPGDAPPAETGGGTVRIQGGIPPPKFKDELTAPPSSVPAPATPAKVKKPWWEKRQPTSEELSGITDSFASLIQEGYAWLADFREYPDWKHDDKKMAPYRVIIRQLLKRLEFDPSMLLIIGAILQIAYQEGNTLRGDLKFHKERREAKERAEKAAKGEGTPTPAPTPVPTPTAPAAQPGPSTFTSRRRERRNRGR